MTNAVDNKPDKDFCHRQLSHAAEHGAREARLAQGAFLALGNKLMADRMETLYCQLENDAKKYGIPLIGE